MKLDQARCSSIYRIRSRHSKLHPATSSRHRAIIKPSIRELYDDDDEISTLLISSSCAQNTFDIRWGKKLRNRYGTNHRANEAIRCRLIATERAE
jgi:hypothetical protein